MSFPAEVALMASVVNALRERRLWRERMALNVGKELADLKQMTVGERVLPASVRMGADRSTVLAPPGEARASQGERDVLKRLRRARSS